jgi:hypothetical protein
MLGIPFATPLQQNTRYRLRFQVTGANPVTLTGSVERLNGTVWELSVCPYESDSYHLGGHWSGDGQRYCGNSL